MKNKSQHHHAIETIVKNLTRKPSDLPKTITHLNNNIIQLFYILK